MHAARCTSNAHLARVRHVTAFLRNAADTSIIHCVLHCLGSAVHTDAVVSATFLLMIALLSVTVFEALTKAEGRLMATLLHCELLAWCCPVAYFVLRYASLGSATNAR
jgi:hypothetical protein